MMEIRNVDVSLSHGQLFNKKQFVFVYLGMAACCLLLILPILMLCVPEMEWARQMVVAIVFADVLAVAFMSLLVYVEIKNRKLQSKIKLWLEDAVEIRAYSKKIGENRLGIKPKATKIQIRFSLNKKHYSRESTYQVFGGEKGYVGCFNKFADKEVNILYSLKYDEVMILKDKK